MGTKMKIGPCNTTYKDYPVSGNSLEDIWADIGKKGFKVKGKVRAGYTHCQTSITPKRAHIDGKMERNKKGEHVITAWWKSLTISSTCVVNIPKLTSTTGLSAAAKAEWERFVKGVKAHEEEHLKVTKAFMAKTAKKIEALSKTATHKDQKKAVNLAQAALIKFYDQNYSDAALKTNAQKDHDALDAGGHGPDLNLSIK